MPINSGGGGGTSQYPALTTVDATLAANVPLSSGAYTDGASAVFAVGTWLIVYKCLSQLGGTTGAEEYTARLWDGTTVYDESQNDSTAVTGTVGESIEVTGFAIVVLAAQATLKVSVRADHTSQTLLREVTAGSATSHTATRLSGVRIA